jgi:membrane protein YdbS with pleckstrin-like domain
MKFRARYRKRHIDYIILTIFPVLLLLSFFFMKDYPNRAMFYMVVLLVIGLFAYFFYLTTAVEHMHYILKNQGVYIQHGFTRLLIPYEQIYKVERVQKTNWQKITGTSWKNYFAGYFHEFKYGVMRIFGTSKSNVILLFTEDMIYGVTPYDNTAFLEQIQEKWSGRKDFRPAKPVASRIWQDSAALVSGVVNILLIAVLAVLIYLAASNYWFAVLDYNLLGEATASSAHYELLMFPLACAAVFFQMARSTDQLMQNGFRPGGRTILNSILVTILVIGIVLAFIFA